MEDKIIELLKNNRRDLREIIESKKKTSVSYRLSTEKGKIYITFNDLGKNTAHKFSIRRDEERYKIRFNCELDGSEHITGMKDILYNVSDNLLPELEASVSQDYPSKSVKLEEFLTEEEAKKLLRL